MLVLLLIFRYWYIVVPLFILLVVLCSRIEKQKEREKQAQKEAQECARQRAAEKRRQDEQRRREEQARERAAQQLREQQARLEKERQRKEAQILKEKARKEKELSMSKHQLFIAEQRRLMTDSLRYDILARDNFRCQLCGASASEGVKLHVDHIYPVSKGGKTEPTNLRTLCERCNLGKSDKIEAPPTRTIMPKAPSFQPTSPTSHFTSEELLSQLNAHGIKWIDNRNRGGCLWIELTDESNALLEHALVDSKPVYHAAKSKAFGNQPALFIK